MTIFMYANNVNTTLAGSVSSSATNITLSSAANLPASIPSGQFLVITLNDQATRQNFEIVYATAISGATLTVQRGQEGTAALSWGVGDFAYSPPTAGQMGNLGQLGTTNTWTGSNTFSQPVGVGAAVAPGQAMQLGQAVGRLIGVQVFTSSGTYTPSAGMTFAIMKVQGGGGSGAGITPPSAGGASLGAPGGAGAYAEGLFTAAQIGASQIVTVGAAGSVGIAAAGGNGGTSSVGSLISAPGGVGGGLLNNQPTPQVNGNGVPSSAPAGANIFGCVGACQGYSFAATALSMIGGAGGSGMFGPGPSGAPTNSSGAAASNPGCGGSGTAGGSGSAALQGGTGFRGHVEIWEYY